MAKGEIIKELPELKNVPGFGGKYVASYEGTVYRCYSKGYAPLTPTLKRGCPTIRLQRIDGTRQEMLVARAVQLAWIGETPTGKVRYHKNGIKTDNIVGNLGFITRSELGKKTGGSSRRKPVTKVDIQTNEVVDAYSSARQAARKNHMSYQTVMDCCNRKNKTPVAPDGYRYSWENDDG